MVGHMLIDRRRVAFHPPSLAGREFAKRRRKAWVGDEMCRTHHRGHETPGHLVLALGARFEALQFPLDAVFDALVVAGLEMQAVIVAPRAPIAAEQGIVTHEKYRDRDGLPAHSRHFE